MNKSKGLTLTELLISTSILAIMMLSLANFSFDVLDVAAKHSQHIQQVQNARLSTERITEQINSAAYIYPSGKTLSLTFQDKGEWDSDIINTDSAVALLVPFLGNDEYLGEGTFYYNTVIYYFKDQFEGSRYQDLYEFSTNYPSTMWETDTIPEVSFGSGTVTKIAEDILVDSDDLTYILNYNNSPTDTVLKGEIGGAEVSDDNALIKGVDWTFDSDLQKGVVTNEVKGLSRNVPRYYFN